jgi:hypothetical protein
MSNEPWGTVVVTQDNESVIFSRAFTNEKDKINSVLEANRKAVRMARIEIKKTFAVSLHYKKDIYQILGYR